MMPLVGVAVLVTALGLSAPQDRYAVPDPFESNVRTMREAVRLPPGGSRNPALLALIQLNDPELRPLFQSLVQRQDRPVMQADAIVGIASVDPRATLDPFILRQVSDVNLRSEIIKTLIGRGLLKPAEINQILHWPEELLPEDRLFLVATLQREGAPWEASELDALADTKVSELRALTALLLLEKGASKAWDEFRPVIAGMSAEERSTLLGSLAPAIRAYKLKAAAPALLRLASDREVDANVRAAVIGSALELDPALGVTALRQEVEQDRSPRNITRHALLLLVSSEREGIDPAVYEVFADSGSREIDALIAAARCAHGGPECAAAFTTVIDLGIRPAAEWCMLRAEELAATDPDLSRAVMRHVLALGEQAKDPREPILLLAVRAATNLVELDPDHLRTLLLASSTPAPISEAIALALIEATDGQFSARNTGTAEEREARAAARRTALTSLVRSVQGKLPRRFDSMATVALARTGATLPPAEVEHLGTIGAGGGRVDLPIQIQASWLYLKALGRQRDALARLAPE